MLGQTYGGKSDKSESYHLNREISTANTLARMEDDSRSTAVPFAKSVPFDPQFSFFQISDEEEKPEQGDLVEKKRDPLILPAQFYLRGTLQSLSLNHGVEAFVAVELNMSRLNQIHQHLWIAGRTTPGRPLHQHIVHGRKITCTEQTDLHLLWEDTRLFVKPCPDYLLTHEFWKRHICHDRELWGVAVGLLLSYTWLIQHKSDFRIAHAEGLLPDFMTWERWNTFAASLAQRMEVEGNEDVNPRFLYGNLRLARINWIYRIRAQSRKGHALVNGFFNIYPSYESFFSRNTAPLTVVAVYFALILGAMQVGLATDRLGKSQTFQNASLFATLLAIIGPLGVLAMFVMFVMSYVFFWNLFRTVIHIRAWNASQTTIRRL